MSTSMMGTNDHLATLDLNMIVLVPSLKAQIMCKNVKDRMKETLRSKKEIEKFNKNRFKFSEALANRELARSQTNTHKHKHTNTPRQTNKHI